MKTRIRDMVKSPYAEFHRSCSRRSLGDVQSQVEGRGLDPANAYME